MRKLTALFALSLALSMQAQQHVMTLDVSKPTAKIQPEMYGIFFEDINFGADGGLYVRGKKRCVSKFGRSENI